MGLLALAVFVGCASIRPAFDAARDAALAAPPPLPADWKADVVVQLSPALIDDVLSQVLAQPLRADLLDGQLSVTQRVRTVTLHPSARCASCLAVDVAMDGRVSWLPGTPLAGSARVETTASGDAELAGARTGSGWTATVRLASLTDANVVVEGKKLIPAVGSQADRTIRDWVLTELPRHVPPIPLTVLGNDALPLLAFRVLPEGAGVRVEARSSAAEGSAAHLAAGAPAEGFRLAVSARTALAMGRAEAFRRGDVGYGVVPEPVSLALERGPAGDGFALGLRLWRPVGRGWWRDYTIKGKLALDGGKVRFTPTDVVEGDKSPGAAAADPLAALFEGKILDAIASAVQTPIPAALSASLGGARLDATLRRLDGVDGALVVTGSAVITPTARP